MIQYVRTEYSVLEIAVRAKDGTEVEQLHSSTRMIIEERLRNESD
jgi:hypothetical protein